MSGIALTEADGVRLLAFRRHLLDAALLAELAGTLDDLAAEARPLVLTGGGRIFLAGAHLGEIARLGAGTAGDYARRGRAVLSRLERHPAPVVAAVRGACAGGALDLALACDLVVVHPRARLGHPGVRRGLVTGWGGTARLAALPRTMTARLVLTGAFLSGAEAAAAGLADRVAEDTEAAAVAAALRLARLDPRRVTAWRLLKSGRFVDRSPIPVVHRLLMMDSEPWERA